MAMNLLMYRGAALALAGGWLLLAGPAIAQTTQPTNPPGTTSGTAPGTPATPNTRNTGHMPATVHQQQVLRNLHNNNRSKKMPATVHQQQVLKNLHKHPSAAPTHQP
jgi:hypothetical protein